MWQFLFARLASGMKASETDGFLCVLSDFCETTPVDSSLDQVLELIVTSLIGHLVVN